MVRIIALKICSVVELILEDPGPDSRGGGGQDIISEIGINEVYKMSCKLR